MLWFKAKKYGWGWTPAVWQGWAVTVGYAAAIAVDALVFLRAPLTASEMTGYFITILILTAILIFICYKTGEKPGWRWGDRTK